MTIVRDHKDQIAVQVTGRCRERHIRALVGGGSILTAQGLMSPSVARRLSIVVDPASQRDLLALLGDMGWRSDPRRTSFSILPAVKTRLVHDSWQAGLNVFCVIPGFFADPETTFDLLWERRREVPVLGALIPGLDRLASATLASHNSLDGRGAHASSNSAFFADQFRAILSPEERAGLGDLVRAVGGGSEMRIFLEAMGIEPVEFTLPSRGYVSLRTGVEDASDSLRRAVAVLDLPRRARRELWASPWGRPRSASDLWAAVRSIPATMRGILGAKKRVAAR